jgi:DNA (cytosine-5)-methyltransferase 1
VTAVDLFAGAGGASRGVHDAGHDVVGFEYWQPAVDTHIANGLPAHLHDLSDPTLDHLIPACDLLWASPPCQPFSAAGDGEGEFDDRDGFPWTLRILAARLPAVAIIENVKGLTFEKHGDYFGGILQQLTRLGYDWDWKVLNSADYGVPQTRERCFIVARRAGGPITWPTVTHTETAGLFTLPWVTIAQALGWGDGVFVLDYRQTDGRNGYPIFCHLAGRPSPTIHTGAESQWVIHPRPLRKGAEFRLTIAELAALQGFPADWVWTGTKTAQARQVGNAVPPIMARLLIAANRPLTLEVAA